jgi:RNA polymerase sigma-70 factor (ECF subfamily)
VGPVADADEFAEFVAGSLPALLRFGHLLTGDAASAEDLVQLALSRAWRNRDRIDAPYAYVRRVMINSNSSWWRRYRRELMAPRVISDDEALADPSSRIDDRDAVWRALRSLPTRQREIVVLRYYEDLSERQIADLLGISTGTVKSQASRALRRLTQVLPEVGSGASRNVGVRHD